MWLKLASKNNHNTETKILKCYCTIVGVDQTEGSF